MSNLIFKGISLGFGRTGANCRASVGSLMLTDGGRGNIKMMTKLLFLGAQTELSELPVHEHIRNEL